MKSRTGLLCCLLLVGALRAQEIAPPEDTTIYRVVEAMPRFPGCENLDTTEVVKAKCAEANLLAFFYENIVYPLEARQNGNEGTVVLSFVVEKDGYISQPKIIKDIGGGCGEEALRVARGMNEALKNAGLKWTPGRKDGRPVRVAYTLPLRFKLEEPPDFVLIGRDTVYVVLDDTLGYQGGWETLRQDLDANLKFPKGYSPDSCFIGNMDLKALIYPDGFVKVVDVSDYFNLGPDFQFEAIRAVTSTAGKWLPAHRNGRPVTASIDLGVTFLPEGESCAQRRADYETAQRLALEGSTLINEEKQEEGIAKLTQAIELFPQNAQYRYLRGQAYVNLRELEKACEDFRVVRQVMSVSVVEELYPLICRE